LSTHAACSTEKNREVWSSEDITLKLLPKNFLASYNSLGPVRSEALTLIFAGGLTALSTLLSPKVGDHLNSFEILAQSVLEQKSQNKNEGEDHSKSVQNTSHVDIVVRSFHEVVHSHRP